MTEEVSLDLTLQNADQLFDENHYQEVIDVLSKYSDQDSAEIQWRKARAYYSLSKSAKEKSEREKLIRQSYELIQQALEKDDKNFAIHKWMAIVMDANAELDGIKARVSQLELMKNHISRSLELNPDDPTTWHLLGAFEFALAELPWIQRKIVSAIFATPPTGTYEKALECFEKAESIKPGFYSSNWLMAGKCYLALEKKKEAKEFLEKAANCRVLNEDDKKSKEEATQLLKKI